MLALFLSLFWVFFYIGIFGFGGGYAMVSLIQFEVVNQYAWMSGSEFANLLALSQMTPGPISINAATYVGYNVFLPYGHLWAIAGSLVATAALVLPSFLLMWLVVKFLFGNAGNVWVQRLFSGLRPAVVGLIFSAGLLMMVDCDALHNFVSGASLDCNFSLKTENFGSSVLANAISLAICAATFVAVYFFKRNPMALIALSGLVGFVCYYPLGSYLPL